MMRSHLLNSALSCNAMQCNAMQRRWEGVGIYVRVSGGALDVCDVQIEEMAGLGLGLMLDVLVVVVVVVVVEGVGPGGARSRKGWGVVWCLYLEVAVYSCFCLLSVR